MPGESKMPEGRVLLGGLESGNTQLGPIAPDCRERMAAVHARETPRQPHREGRGAVCLHGEPFCRSFVCYPETAKEKRS